MNPNESNNDPPNTDGSGTAEARRALDRLAAHAKTAPTKPLGTYEMATEPTDVDRRQSFEWSRLAVAAALVAVVGAGVVVLNQRAGDSAIAPVDPIQIDSGQQGDSSGGAPSLAAGFGPAPSDDAGDSRLYAQRQYAESVERPESGRFLTITDVPDVPSQSFDYSLGDFYVTFEPGPTGTVPPTTVPSETTPTPTEPGWATTVPDTAGSGPPDVPPTVPPWATTVPETVESGPPDVPPTEPGWATTVPGEPLDSGNLAEATGQPASMVVRTVNPASVLCASMADNGVQLPSGGSVTYTDGSDCGMLMMTEVDGSSVAVFAFGLSDSEFQAVMANIVPASDGFGHEVTSAALPAGLSEIAAGSITTMFEPLSATNSPIDRIELAWTPGSPEANPVLDSAGVDQAKIRVIADGGTGLDGQRLLLAEVRDATVGEDPAVVQVGESGAVRVVWRHDGTLFMYEEIGSGADADETVRRVGDLLPFIGEVAGGQYPTETTVPATTAVFYCYDQVPTTFDLEWEDGSVPVTVDASFPPVGCVTVPPSTGPIEPAAEPDHHTPTTGPNVATTETTPMPPHGGELPTPTTPAPYPYPDSSDPLGTTTLPEYYGGNSATTTYPGQ